MNIRTTLNKNPMIVVAILVIGIAAAAWSIYRSVPKGPADTKIAYYSSDDGKTWFEADAKEVPPITHEGKSAVRVRLFTCPDGKKFAGYLERFTDEAKAVLDQFAAAKAAMKAGGAKPNINMGAVQAAGMGGLQVKKVGDKQWVSGNSGPGVAIKKVTCPNGEAATAAE